MKSYFFKNVKALAASAFIALLASASLHAAPMSGTYTVCASGCDYSSVADAAAALNSDGISGPVTINIAAGTYDGEIAVNDVSGSSASNTITFTGAGVSSTHLTSPATVINLGKCKYVAFKALNIVALKGETAVSGYFAQNCTFSGCRIVAPADIDGRMRMLLRTNYAFYMQYTKALTIDNCVIRGGQYSVFLYQVGTANAGQHKITNNHITQYYDYGIYSQSYLGGGGSEYSYNYVDSSVSFQRNGYAIYSDNENGITVKNNRLAIDWNNAVGLFIYHANDVNYNGTDKAQVINNFIGGRFIALLAYMGDNTQISHNTINATTDGGHTQIHNIAGASAQNIEVSNNSFTNTWDNYIVIMYRSGSSNFKIYGNNYYSFSQNFKTQLDGIDYNSFTDYVTATGDGGAKNMVMPFMSATDLHLDPSGTAPKSDYYAGVNSDIDGDTRSLTSPAMGADEPGQSNSLDIALSASSVCAGNTITVGVTASGIYNSGNTFTVEMSDASGSFSNPTTIGSKNGTSSTSITVTIPSSTASGNYKIRVVSSNPNVTSGEAGITINSAPTANAGSDKTVYYGYAPKSSATLSGSASGGSGTYTYKWSTGATTASITVSPTSTTTYTLTVTDVKGCSSADQVVVKVIDVRCGNKNDKVNVCHNGNQICVDANAVPAHLNHGCSLGSCNGTGSVAFQDVESLQEMEVSVYPNPSNGLFTLQLDIHEDQANITVTNMLGRQVALIAGANAGTFTIDLSNEAPGVYLINIQTANENIVKRIVVSQ